MAKITEDYVSFETAKLLKEKGFDGDINFWYNETGNEIFFQQKYDLMYNWRVRQGLEIYQCPTLQMAMKWLREVHNLYIEITTSSKTNEFIVDSYRIDIVTRNFDTVYVSSGYDTYEQAAETAIKYCLEKLI